MGHAGSWVQWLMAVPAAWMLALAPVAARAEAPPEADSGTAFVVHSSGLLATCAHVVKAAGNGARVEVVVGGQTLEARVVAQDEPRDLALLQVTTAGLPVLPLAAGSARLGEEVRAFGFPLRGALGDSLKVTRGTVSGIDGEAAERSLQIDATINPGNSGGPLVNDRGEVVGVVMARLDMNGAVGVGFAVPVEAVAELIRKQGTVLPAPLPGARLEGPELVGRVQPAVARVTVHPRSKGSRSAARKHEPAAVPSATPVKAAPKPAPVAPLASNPAPDTGAGAKPAAPPSLPPAEIDRELAKIRETNPPPFPKPRADAVTEGEEQVNWLIVNDTNLPLLVLMNGTEKRSVLVKPQSQERIVLKPGAYEMGGRLENSDIEPFLGKFDLVPGGRYRSRFYLAQ